jgi:glycosyltransferase involved in cell wall biosynthesis
MRILYIIDKPNMYGSERHLLDILNYQYTRNDIYLITFSKGNMLKYIPDIKSKLFNLSWFLNIFALIDMYKYIKELSPDIIHCHQPKGLFIGSIIGFILKITTIVTIHSRAYDHAFIHKNIVKKVLVYLFHKFINSITLLFSKQCIYVNKSMYKSSFVKNKSIYLSNWLNHDFKYNAPKTLKYDNPLKFISVGSFTHSKGFDILIDFFEYLKEKDLLFEVDIYGSIQGTLYDELKFRINKLSCINFKGFSNSIHNEYKKADFYILFSRSETFGLSYLEAMSQGLPVISLNLNDLKEFIPLENILENDFDKIYCKLIGLIDNIQYNNLSMLNIEISKKYSYENKMEELENVYENISHN